MRVNLLKNFKEGEIKKLQKLLWPNVWFSSK